jgi:hypothetical protein
MASRVPDKTTDGRDGATAGEGGQPPLPGRQPETDEAEKSEAEKAATEKAAGDVADDLADFA